MYLNRTLILTFAVFMAAPLNAFWPFFGQSGQKQMISDAKAAYSRGDYHTSAYLAQEFLLKNSGRGRAKEAYMMLGNSYKAMGQLDKAMLKYNEAIEFYPKDAQLTLALADIYFRGGLTDKAIEVYKKVLTLDKGNASAVLGLARSYLSEGFFGRSSKYFEQYLKDNPGDDKIYYDYALSRFYANDYDAALSEAQKSMDFKKEAQTEFLLAKIYKARGEKAKAFNAIDLALKQNPGDDAVFLTRALWLAYNQETAAQGLKEAEKYLSGKPGDRLALFIKALGLYRTGYKKEAYKTLKTAAEEDGDGFINKISRQILQKAD